jgi:hypothetical protein
LARDDIPAVVTGDGVDFRSQEVEEMSIAWVQLAAGSDLRPALVGLEADLCQCPHWGYMLRGQLRMHTADGQLTFLQRERYPRRLAAGVGVMATRGREEH